MRKGHISLLLRDFSYIMTFLRFQGEPSGFTSKDRILGGLRRRVEVQGSQEHQNKQGEARKRAEARTGVENTARQAAQQCGTAVPSVQRRGLSVFAVLFSGHFFIPPLFPSFCFLL